MVKKIRCHPRGAPPSPSPVPVQPPKPQPVPAPPKRLGNPLWEKGKSGNPAGRPKEIAYLREICRARTDEAIATLIEVMRDKTAPPASRTLAANSILDRGYGKPTTVIEGSGILPIIDISDAARRIAFAINQAIDAGEEIEGDFTEVLPIAAPSPADTQ